MRDTYTNSITTDVLCKSQNELYLMTYAVKSVEHLFTWCAHERYPMIIEINQ